MERIKRWKDENYSCAVYGINLEIRAEFAWSLITSHPNVAGIENGEDRSGRSQLRLQTPEDLVTRSFEIVDRFFDAVEKRGEIRESVMTDEERAKRVGHLEAIKTEEAYKPMRQRAET